MLYILCDGFGVPLEDTDKVSDSDPRFDAVQPFGMQDKDGNAIDGYLVTLEGSIHRAIADVVISTNVLPSEPDTDDEIHIPANIDNSD